MSRISTRTGIRIAVATGATVLCAGASVPAIAHGLDSGDARTVAAHHYHLSFADQKAQALRLLSHESQWLTGLKQKVAADDRLTADQKAAFTTKLDDALAQVEAARTAVQNAGTRAELRTALGRAELPYLAYPKYVLPSLAQLQAGAEHLLAARQARLADLRDRVASDDRLTDAQKSAFTAKIDAALADLARAKDAVAAATTREQVAAALAAVTDWRAHYPRHHLRQHRMHRTEPDKLRLVSATVRSAPRTVTVHRAVDPSAVERHWGCTGHRDANRNDVRFAGARPNDRQWRHDGQWRHDSQWRHEGHARGDHGWWGGHRHSGDHRDGSGWNGGWRG
jgi:hypothetical protein